MKEGIIDKETPDLTFEQLVAAYHDCRKHKRTSKDQLDFEINLEENLRDLYYDLKNGTWAPGKSITFIVTRPKPREVFAAHFRDRIVHHLLIRQIESLFEEVFIPDNYNCRVGKGVLYGVNSLKNKIELFSENYKNHVYIMKCDMKGFFMSIDKTILWNRLEEFLRINYTRPNLEFIIRITKLLSFHCPEKDCEYRGDKD